jgi:hypothetical protein
MATFNCYSHALYLPVPSIYDFGSGHTAPSYGFKGITYGNTFFLTLKKKTGLILKMRYHQPDYLSFCKVPRAVKISAVV